MTTALVATLTNAYLDSGTDTWLATLTGMAANSAKSTGGYASYTAG